MSAKTPVQLEESKKALFSELKGASGRRSLVVQPHEVTSSDTRCAEEIHADAMSRGAKCTQCPLYGLHVGPVKSTVVAGKLGVLADAPGPVEITTGIPMSPEAGGGKFLNEHLEAVGLSRAGVSIINVTECRAPEGYAEYRKRLVSEHKTARSEFNAAKKAWKKSNGTSGAARKASSAAPDVLPLTPEEACAARFQHDVKKAVEMGTNTFLTLGNNALRSYAQTYKIPYGGKVKAAPGEAKITNLKRTLGCVMEFKSKDGSYIPTIVPSYQPAYGLMKGSRQYAIGIGRWIRRAALVAQRGGKTSWKPPARLITRPTVEQVEYHLGRMAARSHETGAPVYCDIETDGINVKTAKILCIAFGQRDADGEWTVIVIPWRHGTAEHKKTGKKGTVSSKGGGNGGAYWWSLKAPVDAHVAADAATAPPTTCAEDPDCAPTLFSAIQQYVSATSPETVEAVELELERRAWTRAARPPVRVRAEAGSDAARIFAACSTLLNDTGVSITGHNFNGFDARKLWYAGFLKDKTRAFRCTMLGNKNTYACDTMHNLGFSCALRFEVNDWKSDANDKFVENVTDEHLWTYCGYDVYNTGLLDEHESVEHIALGSVMQNETDIACAAIGKNMGEIGLMLDPHEFTRTRALMRDQRTQHFRQLGQLVYQITNGATELKHLEEIDEWFPGIKYNLETDAEEQFRFHPESSEMVCDILFGQSKYSRKHKPLVGIHVKDGAPEERPYVDGDKISLTAGSLIKLREHLRRPDELTKLAKNRDVLATQFIDSLLEYRAFTKITSTYIEGLIRPRGEKGVRECHTCNYRGVAYFGNCQRCGTWLADTTIMQEEDGFFWLHPNYKYLIPTGRWSADPTIQTYPERGKLNTRRAFIAPPGHLWVGADLDQVELRLYAIISGDEKLIQVINWRGPIDPKTGKAMQIDAHAWNYATIKAKNPDNAREIKAIYDYVLKLKNGGEADKQKCKMYRNIAKRFCIAEGTPVLTRDRGEVAIESILPSDLLWDGVEWVSHAGVICNGEKEVISYDGLEATADHKVWVEDGRKLEFGAAAQMQLRLARTASGRDTIRFVGDTEPTNTGGEVSDGVGSLCLRCGGGAEFGQSTRRKVESLPDLQSETAARNARVASHTLSNGEATLCESQSSELGPLWRSWDSISVQFCRRSGVVGADEFGSALRNGNRPTGQQRALRTRQLTLGVAANQQYESNDNQTRRIMGVCACGVAVQGETRPQITLQRNDQTGNFGTCVGDGDRGAAVQSVGSDSGVVSNTPRRTTRVYDIVNAGPRHRFTANGKLVSNCYLIAYGGEKEKLYETMRNDRDKESGELMFPGLKEDECGRWYVNWHRAHPQTKLWQAACVRAARRDGFVTSPLIDYRRRYFPGQQEKGLNQQNAASNSVIQPSAAAITNRWVQRVNEWWQHRGWSQYSGLNLQVHDALGGYCPAHMAAEVCERLVADAYFVYDGMEFTADGKYGRSWADV